MTIVYAILFLLSPYYKSPSSWDTEHVPQDCYTNTPADSSDTVLKTSQGSALSGL